MDNIRKTILKPLYMWFITHINLLKPIYETRNTGCPINFQYLFFQKILGFNRRVPWPVHFTSKVTGEQYIKIGINTAPGVSLGNYIFASADAPIYVGDYTVIASNVCVGAFNHNIYNISQYVSKGEINIGHYCWVGANAVILSGVTLGDHTVVAAGAIVTKPFPEGYCVIAGNPAKVVKKIEPEKVVKFTHPYRYIGYKKLD
ncbi:MAG: acyltransferase [Gammaproteobacteria bacterium]